MKWEGLEWFEEKNLNINLLTQLKKRLASYSQFFMESEQPTGSLFISIYVLAALGLCWGTQALCGCSDFSCCRV